MSRAMLRKRLVALTAIVRPADSFEAKLAGLSPEQRSAWERHKVRRDEWRACFSDPADAYAAMLGDNPGPELRPDVWEALYGPMPVIPENATVEEAAAIYEAFKGG